MNKEEIKNILQQLQTKQQSDPIPSEIITQLQTTLTKENVQNPTQTTTKLLIAHLTILHLTAPNPPYSEDELKMLLLLFQHIFNTKFDNKTLKNQKRVLKMIEICEFIETTKILLFLFDIEKKECLTFIQMMIQRYLLLKSINEKYCEIVKNIIETMYRESTNGEERMITKMFISVFDSIELPFLSNQNENKSKQKNMQNYLSKNMREKELLNAIFGDNKDENVVSIFKRGFFAIVEQNQKMMIEEFDENEEINYENVFNDDKMEEENENEEMKEKEGKKEHSEIHSFIHFLGKLIYYFPDIMRKEETYLEQLLLLPIEEERMKMIEIVIYYLNPQQRIKEESENESEEGDNDFSRLLEDSDEESQMKETKENKMEEEKEMKQSQGRKDDKRMQQLKKMVIERRKDKSIVIRNRIMKYIINEGKEEIEKIGENFEELVIEKINDIEVVIRENTLEEIKQMYYNSINEEIENNLMTKNIIKELMERMKDRKESVREKAQELLSVYVRNYIIMEQDKRDEENDKMNEKVKVARKKYFEEKALEKLSEKPKPKTKRRRKQKDEDEMSEEDEESDDFELAKYDELSEMSEEENSEDNAKKQLFKEYEEYATKIANRLIETMDEIKNEEDRIRIFGLISNTILGEIENNKLKNKNKIDEIVKMRCDSLIILFDILEKDNIEKLLKYNKQIEEEKKEFTEKLDHYFTSKMSKEQEKMIQNELIQIVNKIIPIPSKETAVKYNKKIVESLTKEFHKEYMKLQKKDIAFEKYWKITNEIMATIDIQRNTKVQSNLNKFIDKITNTFV